MRVIVLALPLLLLTACGAASPTWMPAGYSWHNDEYKAQPGPEAENLGYPYSAARNDSIVDMWAGVAKGLVDNLEARTGMTPQDIYVATLPESNAFNLSLDNALRDELRARGYTLADSAQGVVGLKYQAFKTGDENKRVMIQYNGDDEQLTKPWNPEQTQEFTFVLTLVRDGAAFGEARSKRVLPAYGYVAGEGNILPAPRVMEGAGQ